MSIGKPKAGDIWRYNYYSSTQEGMRCFHYLLLRPSRLGFGAYVCLCLESGVESDLGFASNGTSWWELVA